jgi:AhpD family alkylhydroperoxidase
MSLTVKEKELVNIGASVANGCKPCTDYHFKKVRQAGATDEEIKDAITYAMLVRDSAKEIMENYGLQQLEPAIKEDLGLFTSYNIVQNHQGHIEVESEVGKENTFRVILPKDLDKKELLRVEREKANSSGHRCEQMEKGDEESSEP